MSIDYNQEMTAINAELQNQRPQIEPVSAHYYTFSDADSRLVASLTVLLDSELRAQRAELMFYENPPVQAQSAVTRQAKNIVTRNYAGSGDTTEIRIMESRGQGATQVQHSGLPLYKKENSYRLWPIATAIAIIFIVVVLVLLMSVLARNPENAEVAQALTPAATATVTPTVVAGAPPGSTEMQSSDGQTYLAQTNGLPPSINADARLAPGDNARIRPGLAAYLRSDPGPTAGQELVIMQDGQVGRIVGGPVWLPGETDTIVWWFLELEESGIQDWASANTSQIMVLEEAR